DAEAAIRTGAATHRGVSRRDGRAVALAVLTERVSLPRAQLLVAIIGARKRERLCVELETEQGRERGVGANRHVGAALPELGEDVPPAQRRRGRAVSHTGHILRRAASGQVARSQAQEESGTGSQRELWQHIHQPATRIVTGVRQERVSARVLARVGSQRATAVPGPRRCGERSAAGQSVVEHWHLVLRGPVHRPEVAQLGISEATQVALDRRAIVIPARTERDVRIPLAEPWARLGPAPTECGGGGDQVHALL